MSQRRQPQSLRAFESSSSTSGRYNERTDMPRKPANDKDLSYSDVAYGRAMIHSGTFRISTAFEPRGDQAEAVEQLGGRAAGRREAPGAARSHRLRQDLHDGEGDRGGPAPRRSSWPTTRRSRPSSTGSSRTSSPTTPSSTSSRTTTTTSRRRTSRRPTPTSRRMR